MPHTPSHISRRTFLERAGAGLVVTRVAAVTAGAQAPPPSRKVGWAIVGLGSLSINQILPAFATCEASAVTALVSGSPDKARKLAATYGVPETHIYSYANYDAIKDNPDIDVVYVVLPNHLHKPFTLRAAAADKHVWCEKPMAMDAAEARAMIDACRRHRVHLAIGYRMQHEPNTQAVMALARSRPFGRLQRVRAEAGFRGFDGASGDNWRLDPARGGGAMYDMGVYALNAARYTIGAEPIAVTATSSMQRPDVFRGVDETTRFRLEFPDGVMAECATSFGENMNLLRADCADGWYELSPFQAYEGVRGEASDGRRFDVATGATPAQQARQMDADALAILERRPPRVPGEEGWRDMRVLDAIFASARADGNRVEIASG